MTGIPLMVVLACGYLLAVACGASGYLAVQDLLKQRQYRQTLVTALNEGQPVGDRYAVDGLAAKVLVLAAQESQRARLQPLAGEAAESSRRFAWAFDKYPALIKGAGLMETLSAEGCKKATLKLMVSVGAVGAVIGYAFSWELMLLLALIGALLGFRAVAWALEQEARARCAQVEANLSQMLEVVMLGLRGGLSFDRSLELYATYFSNPLAWAAEQALQRWEWGLMSREDSLRTLASDYGSSLLSRAVESIVRSLRFGTSLADVLEDVAQEARLQRKALLEEKVAKAPIKMMVPVGVLILPAMLLLVLGPVLLELAGGF